MAHTIEIHRADVVADHRGERRLVRIDFSPHCANPAGQEPLVAVYRIWAGSEDGYWGPTAVEMLSITKSYSRESAKLRRAWREDLTRAALEVLGLEMISDLEEVEPCR